MPGPEFNPRDDEPMDRDEYEAWEKERAFPCPGPIIDCPNCESKMNEGESCPECDHSNDGNACNCAFCESVLEEIIREREIEHE